MKVKFIGKWYLQLRYLKCQKDQTRGWLLNSFHAKLQVHAVITHNSIPCIPLYRPSKSPGCQKQECFSQSSSHLRSSSDPIFSEPRFLNSFLKGARYPLSMFRHPPLRSFDSGGSSEYRSPSCCESRLVVVVINACDLNQVS